jgi:hypothetical protein
LLYVFSRSLICQNDGKHTENSRNNKNNNNKLVSSDDDCEKETFTRVAQKKILIWRNEKNELFFRDSDTQTKQFVN